MDTQQQAVVLAAEKHDLTAPPIIRPSFLVPIGQYAMVMAELVSISVVE